MMSLLFLKSFHYRCFSPILLTEMLSEFPESLENVTNTLETLFIYENWYFIVIEMIAIGVDEMDHTTKFGDNDRLSALVANITDNCF